MTYSQDYSELPFEHEIRKYRYKKIVELLQTISAKHVLEIGCGNHPIFDFFTEFDTMTIVEADVNFFNNALIKSTGKKNVRIINDYIENAAKKLKDSYDVIIISGFLHEVDNPDEILSSVKSICNHDTVVISFVPNANSFHRLLAKESGLIASNFEFSDNDKKFGRRVVLDLNSFIEMFKSAGYSIENTGSYFIKPFAHFQMNEILNNKLIPLEIMKGLDKMIKYLPGLGCEIFIEARLEK